MNDGGKYVGEDASQLAGELFSGKLTAEEALKRLRARLLDLSMRNRLLNYRHPKGRSIQFVGDVSVEALYERLEDGKSVSLDYVQDPPTIEYEDGKKPDARTYAKKLGISTSVDLAAPHGNNPKRKDALQVLQYPPDLERFARKLSNEARVVVEETGTNMLHLMFGFLEFYESDDSEKPALAPLIAMPVSLTKGNLDPESHTYQYSISHTGEDIVENFSLREKLKQEFRLQLPALDEQDTPGMYFAKVTAATSRRHRWKVLHRVSLGFLSFGKLALWVDLDPAKAEQLLGNPLLRNIFEGGNAQPTEAFHAEDYEIDQHEDADLPLIYDADSSQHSAIIDVKAGKNLVINGPPGTGKSQTITNIIASSLAVGKKVLFISEKLAALEVVKHRLEMAGLGDFCLELHSHKSQKKQLLESIEHRIRRRFRAVNGYEAKLETLRERKKALNRYAHILGSQIENRLGLTVHEIFWAAERKRLEAGECAAEVSNIRLPGASDWDSRTVDRCRTTLSASAAAIDELGAHPIDSPWRGFAPRLMVQGDGLPVIQVIDSALSLANSAANVVQRLAQLTGQDRWTFDEIQNSLKAVLLIPEPTEPIDGSMLEQICSEGLSSLEGARAEARTVSAILEEVRLLDQKAKEHLADGSVDATSFPTLAANAKDAISEQCLRSTTLSLLSEATRLRDAIENIERLLQPTLGYPSAPKELLLKVESIKNLPGERTIRTLAASELHHSALTAARNVEAIQAHLHRLDTMVAPAGMTLLGSADEIEALGRGEISGLKETGGERSSSASILRQASVDGYGDWTAERIAAQASDYANHVRDCAEAQDRIRTLFSRLQLSYRDDRDAIQQAKAILEIAEDAPKDLLAFRSQQFERPDFADLAIRAEEAHKQVVQLHSATDEVFALDLLPGGRELRIHARALKRSDSILNYFRSDWRRARRAYRDCAKNAERLRSETMAERVSLAAKWRDSLEEYSGSQEFRASLGSLFQGTKTDFQKVRRLHLWYRKSSQLLSESGLAGELVLTNVDQNVLMTLAAQAMKVRGWITAIEGLFGHVAASAAFKARHVGNKVTDLLRLLEAEASRQATVSELQRKLVQSSVTVDQALGLLTLQKRLASESETLELLLRAPTLLRDVALPLGLTLSTFESREIREASKRVAESATTISQVANEITKQLGDNVTLAHGAAVVGALCEALALSENLVSPGLRARCSSWRAFTENHRIAVDTAEKIIKCLSPVAKAGSSIWDAGVSAQAALERDTRLNALNSNERLRTRFGKYLNGLETPEARIQHCLDWASSIASNRQRLSVSVVNSLLKDRVDETFIELKEHLQQAQVLFAQYKGELEKLRQFGEFSWADWGGHREPRDAVDRLSEALDAADSLVVWSKYCDAQQEALDLQLEQIIERFRRGEIPPSRLVASFELVFYRSLSKQIFNSRRELARFTGGGHDKLRKDFAALDRELISVNGAQYAHAIDKHKRVPCGIDRGKACDLTEMALLSKETKKQKRHIPIRQLLKRAGNALQELKPCFMMGPLSVAQYLEHGVLEFDLVVMDEASQLRPEDALGAIARGKQIVVVGDPKQLPPTNFFDRLMDADDEDADEAPALIDGIESILGICEHLYRPVRTLRWHYRSKHESLIAFSNSQFYGGRLVVFPSPYERNRLLGVNYRYVKDGVYQDRRNVPEALRVVDAVVHHMLTRPEESLGVVTLNQTQRDLIEDLLDKKLRAVEGVSEYLIKHEEAGWKFFVKNLENVQGDERDVIFISTTFGKAPGTSVVRQTFGPINRPDGWRRLNVLFTRARSRLEVFTSMLPTDVVTDDSVSPGRKVLRDYLEYARTGMLPAAETYSVGREPDSDFEVAVADALRKRGYAIQPQVGVAGYFIDIGVRHPDRRGEFLAGIECDGASYHSSVSARDRDRIRQEILESLGWHGRIIRVWSTDWFADPIAQTNRLARFLEERLSISKQEIVPYADDDLEVFKEIESVAANPTDRAVTEPQSDFNSASDAYVEVGDRVTYLVLDGKESHTVQIVDSASNPKHGLLNERTPVAEALLGLAPGDEAVFRVPGQSSRTIRLLKIHRESMESSDQTDSMLGADK